LMVYIQEAHASDVWQIPANLKQDVVYANPTNAEERGRIAGACVRKLGIEFPALVDDWKNIADRAYKAWPDRLYVIDRDGRVAYKSRPGPWGFKSKEMAQTLRRLAPELAQ
jgi:hypothetical protein